MIKHVRGASGLCKIFLASSLLFSGCAKRDLADSQEQPLVAKVGGEVSGKNRLASHGFRGCYALVVDYGDVGYMSHLIPDSETSFLRNNITIYGSKDGVKLALEFAKKNNLEPSESEVCFVYGASQKGVKDLMDEMKEAGFSNVLGYFEKYENKSHSIFYNPQSNPGQLYSRETLQEDSFGREPAFY